jgi:outer membrane protein TolC
LGAWASGLGRDKNDSFDLLNDGDFLSFTAGVQVTYPLGNRAAKARLRRAAFRVEQARTTLDDLYRAIELQVRTAARQIETNRQRIEATEVSVALAEERLRAEEEALRVGLSTSHDVLEYQEDLTIARGSYTQAVTDYLISCAQLESAQGTLVEALGFRLED